MQVRLLCQKIRVGPCAGAGYKQLLTWCDGSIARQEVGAGKAAFKALPWCLLLRFIGYQWKPAAQDEPPLPALTDWHTAGSLSRHSAACQDIEAFIASVWQSQASPYDECMLVMATLLQLTATAPDSLLHCLQVYPNSNAIVVSTENITQNWYFGNERSMLIPNCLFRVGGACMLLSNK